ncbi:glycosyltransferase family 2 protein (plasmid) [Bernardetia sp. Wsw4-3y2]|uniref:glycosyltransferase family 2 protein n=1 Tax=Bernardetia sp. Wsw4-3y2 TaxID=3127471 RepID=UPI0030CBBE0C
MNKNEPIVSIITPIFNRKDLIKETHQSVISQTYTSWEWIIVDDGSEDNSWKIIQDFAQQDNRIKVIKRERIPKGAPTCRNIGLEVAKGEYVIFLDSDDLLADFCLEQRVEAIKKEGNKYDFLVFPIRTFRQNLLDINHLQLPSQYDDLEEFILWNTPWYTTAPIIKREKTIQWNEKLALYQDVDFNIRMIVAERTYKFIYAKPDVYWRYTEHNSISRSNLFTPQKLEARVFFLEGICEALKKGDKLKKYDKAIYTLAERFIFDFISQNQYAYFKEILSLLVKYEIITTLEFYKLYIILPLIHNQLHYTSLPVLWKLSRKLYSITNQSIPITDTKKIMRSKELTDIKEYMKVYHQSKN